MADTITSFQNRGKAIKPYRKARKIIVNDKQYWYLVGTGGYTIVIWDGCSKKLFNCFDVTGRLPQTVERGQYKKTSDGMIKPSDIKKFIEDKY